MAKNTYDFEYASALTETKDFAKALEYVLPHANAGDSNAQCMMGFLCEFGPLQDLAAAERWLRKVAEQCNAVAWNNLGTLLLHKGENQNAKECYRRPVELGFTMAAPLAE
jgi:TPR repeat protein